MKFSDLESNSSNLASQDCRLEPSVRLLRHYRDSHLVSASDTIICPTAESQLSSCKVRRVSLPSMLQFMHLALLTALKMLLVR